MRVLVTGGAGYIGSLLVGELLERTGYVGSLLVGELLECHEVTVIDNFRYHQTSLAHLCGHSDLNIIRGDIRDLNLIEEQVKKHDCIIPLAGLVGAPLCAQDPVGAISTNLRAPLEMFKMLSPSQMVLMPTTNSAYGTTKGDKPVDETSPLNPISLYAKHKVEVEEALMQRENSVSFRLATVFGMSPRMRLDLLVNDFVYRAVMDKFIVLFESHFKRNYIHVQDVVNVFFNAVADFDKFKGEIFNVGLTQANLSKRELCVKIREYLPDFEIKEGSIASDPDKRNYIVSNAKLEATGWEAAWSLEDGIQELIKGYQMIRNTRYGNV